MARTRPGPSPIVAALGPPDIGGAGPVEAGALRTLITALLVEALDPTADAVTIAAIRSTARSIDRAQVDDSPAAAAGRAGYLAGVLGSLLRDAGIDVKAMSRYLDGVDRDALARAVDAQLAQPGRGLSAVAGDG